MKHKLSAFQPLRTTKVVRAVEVMVGYVVSCSQPQDLCLLEKFQRSILIRSYYLKHRTFISSDSAV